MRSVVHTEATLRRVEQIKILAAEGKTVAEVARIVGIHNSYVSSLKTEFAIEFAPKGVTQYQRDIRRLHAEGKSPTEIASILGRGAKTVKVMLCNMSLTQGSKTGKRQDNYRYRRGFGIPEDRLAEYRELRRLGMTIKECGVEMGLISREPS